MKLDLHADQRLKLAKEMYLKAILQLSKKQEIVKQNDLVTVLDISKSSVNEMVARLKNEGLLEPDVTHSLNLTPKGAKLANVVLKKYTIIKEFLETKLDMSEAHDEACQLEHAFSIEAVEKLDEFLKK
jgi:DtxR family Mn-dependent transcriptional regulator